MLKNLSGFLTTATLAAALILEGNEHSIQQLQAVKNELTTKGGERFRRTPSRGDQVDWWSHPPPAGSLGVRQEV